MWSFKSHVGPTDPKFALMQKGGYHTLHAVIEAIIPDKQFPNFINRANPCLHSCRNYNMNQALEVTVSQQPQEPVTKTMPIVNNVACNSNKKKKKRRRRRKKKSKNNQQKIDTVKTTQIKSPRQRQLSTTSEDSFVIFFGEENEECILELSENETVEDFDSSDSIIPHKKVRFAAESELCEVHPMVMWSYAYQAARRGPWEEYARDRCRFHKRVVNTEALIGHVFAAEHRSRIFQQRFGSL